MNPRDDSLSPLQLDVMRAVWALGEARVADVHARLEERGLAATTVATLLSRLEKRGLLTHRSEGRQYLYRALRSEEDVSRAMVSELTSTLFEGEPARLVSHLLRRGEFDAEDLERIKRLIEEREGEAG